MHMRRSILLPMLLASLTAAGSVVSPAHAGAKQSAAAWHCYMYVSNPKFVRYSGVKHIHGVGRQWCTGSGYVPQGVRLTLQRYRAFGIWRNVHRSTLAWSRSYFVESQPPWPCTGAGSEKYRWVIDGFAQGVPVARKHAYSDPVRIYC